MQPLFHTVLIKPEIPHNTGAIGRLCVGLGCPLHLIRPLGFHLSDTYIKRAGLDYWDHLNITAHDSWQDFLEKTNPPDIHFFSTRGKKSLYECGFKAGDALVFGNESSGLPPEIYTEYSEKLFKIPMPGKHARSINLANAVAIAAYEAFRQIHLG
ncbi:MAG: tRNA (cytidine(34)-2'-O)-methyltransferase [Kiritimatiellia bacterium]